MLGCHGHTVATRGWARASPTPRRARRDLIRLLIRHEWNVVHPSKMPRRLAEVLRGGSTRRRLFPFALALAAGIGSAALVGLSSSQATTPAQNITGNQTLVAGQELESSGGQYVLLLASNGNLEESFNGGQVVWKTTGGAKGDHALLQPNGNLVLISSTGQTLWSSNSAGTGCPSLDLQRDGNLVIYDPSTPAAFTKGLVDKLPSGQKLEPGWLLYAPNGFYYVEMQTDGNLVLRNDVGTALWSSGTAGNAGAYAILQTNGNFVVYSAAGKALWSTDTTGDNGATLAMQDDGNLVLYTTSGAAPWSSKTHDAANSGKDVDPAGPAGSTKPCPAPAPAPTPTRTVTTPPTIMTVTPPPVTVPVPVPVPVPSVTVEKVPVPAPRPRHVRLKVTVKWSWNGAVTRMDRLTVGPLPSATSFDVLYKRMRGRHRRDSRGASTERQLRELIRWLERNRYRPGDRLSLDISRHGWVPERATFTIRDGRQPKLTHG